MPRRAAGIPRIQIRIISGEQEIGIAHDEGTEMPELKEILKTALLDAMQRPGSGAWGPLIEAHFSEGPCVRLPTVQCIHELGLPRGRLQIMELDWENGVVR